MKKRIQNFLQNQVYRRNLLCFLVLPFILNLVIEMMSRTSVIDGIVYMFTHPIPFICNTLIIMVTISVALLVKRRTFLITLISVIWLILGTVNMVLLNVRVTPFNASDLRLLDAARSIIDKYFNVFTITLVIIAFIIIVCLISILFIKGSKIEYKINYWKNTVIIGVIFVICVVMLNISIDTGIMALKFTNLTTAYYEYGFVYCFGNGLVNTGVKKPKDYSQNKIDEILEQIKSEQDDNPVPIHPDDNTRPKATPNIIFLQLESFFDINKVKNIDFSEDPIPYFNSLKEQYPSGYLNVFNVGYGTCNTEFEIMTGMNLDDFGPGEVPYKTVLQKTTCESMAYNLKEYGYSTHAIHNNDGTFYSRKWVFENLGYDTFTSIEYMHVMEFTPMDWSKDKFLTEEILKAICSTEEPDYIYTISVQGHGSYPSTGKIENPVVTVSNISDEGRKNAIEYYANQIREMDEFIKELTVELSELEEDVILVMYGDHLPGLGFSEEDLENGSLYQTEYIIWNNMNLPVENEDLETYQLSAKVMELLGMNSGVINKYHQNYRNDEEYLSGLQNLEYDILYGDKIAYGGINPYTPTELQMGVEPIEITRVEKQETDGRQYVVIHGKHFNKYSRVYVNGDSYNTEYLDEQTLRIVYDGITSLDSFVVSQEDKDDGTVLSSTKECLYYGQ